ncbi:hypothetical protein PR048_023784 [Dryococelus australis]|uniref:Uncharacterized protein n=1 Tax=Dryococelus australis TaxID=614101 RepID=A0ABQ9GV26_9NEOP|nr:hypothetical protein PR048_023784 [Dryococelus australis]
MDGSVSCGGVPQPATIPESMMQTSSSGSDLCFGSEGPGCDERAVEHVAAGTDSEAAISPGTAHRLVTLGSCALASRAVHVGRHVAQVRRRERAHELTLHTPARSVVRLLASPPHRGEPRVRFPRRGRPPPPWIHARWGSCRRTPLVGRLSRGSLVSPALLFQQLTPSSSDLKTSVMSQLTFPGRESGFISASKKSEAAPTLSLEMRWFVTFMLVGWMANHCSAPSGSPLKLSNRSCTIVLSTSAGSSEPRVIKMSMEQRRNEGAGKMGDPRENPPTNGIIEHGSHIRKSGLNPDRLAVRSSGESTTAELLRFVLFSRSAKRQRFCTSCSGKNTSLTSLHLHCYSPSHASFQTAAPLKVSASARVAVVKTLH